MSEENEQPCEHVDVNVRVPKQVLEFMKAVHSFGKHEEPLEEFLGGQITFSVLCELNSELQNMLDMRHIKTSYGLDKVDC